MDLGPGLLGRVDDLLGRLVEDLVVVPLHADANPFVILTRHGILPAPKRATKDPRFSIQELYSYDRVGSVSSRRAGMKGWRRFGEASRLDTSPKRRQAVAS